MNEQRNDYQEENLSSRRTLVNNNREIFEDFQEYINRLKLPPLPPSSPKKKKIFDDYDDELEQIKQETHEFDIHLDQINLRFNSQERANEMNENYPLDEEVVLSTDRNTQENVQGEKNMLEFVIQKRETKFSKSTPKFSLIKLSSCDTQGNFQRGTKIFNFESKSTSFLIQVLQVLYYCSQFSEYYPFSYEGL